MGFAVYRLVAPVTQEYAAMEAIQLLLSDHRKIKNLFERFKAFRAVEDRSQQLRVFGYIYVELTSHTALEEKVFYPACAEYPECTELVEDSIEDHRRVKEVLDRIRAMSQDSREFSTMVEDLIEEVESHMEEEELELFPLVRELMQQAQLLDLGERMEDLRKEELGHVRRAA
jgi:hemerythrin superfamily protein